MLRREVGEEAVAMNRAMLSGGLIVPESNDFGPCFRRTTKMIRRFDVGFDFSSLIGADKVVRDLKPGSEAAKAGIREGDHFTYGVALDAVQADVNRSEEHTSELQSLMRTSYAVFCLKKKI